MLGVDFGSSNTAAAFRDSRGGVHQISLSHNGWLMPSAVLYTPNRTLVGRTAVQAALTDPEAFEPSPKRRLAEPEIHLGHSIVSVTDLIAAVLREVVIKAQREMGNKPDRVVLTHPDKWAAPMQERLREAAVKAGIDSAHIRLISEASAAAWFYTVTERALPVGARLAVFDFGAGTCDVAVLDKQPDQTFSVVASDGVDGLGGHDLDARINAWVRRQLADSNPELADELSQPGAIGARLTLNDRIREAKEALSEASQATIAVANGSRTQLLTLTRDEFDNLISSDLDRAVELTKDVLAAAQRIKPVERPPTIYLTGGSSAIPVVHTRLGALGPLGILGDPKTVVSQGSLHAMVSNWDVDEETLHFAKPKELVKNHPSVPPRPNPPQAAPAPPTDSPTEPAINPEIPWYMQKPDRPSQAPPARQSAPLGRATPPPQQLPRQNSSPQVPAKPLSTPQIPTQQAASAPQVPAQQAASRAVPAHSQPRSSHPTVRQYPNSPSQPGGFASPAGRPPSGPNPLPQRPVAHPSAHPDRSPWIIAAAIIGIAVVVALVAILIAVG
ncbi:MAG: Hsp70 family protein [Mycobacterium sp.]